MKTIKSDKSLVETADYCLSKLYLEGGSYDLSNLGRIFGTLEAILGEESDVPEAQLARECAAIGFYLLEDPKNVDFELVKERLAALFRGFVRYEDALS